MTDHILRGLLGDGSARVVAVVTSETAREAARRHGAVAGAAVALARGATAGLLLATLTKGGERVTLQLVGDGPLGGVTVDANDQGHVRAYLRRAGELVSAGPGRRVRLADAIGRSGVVNVVRDLGFKERYSGQSSLVTGEIDEDVEHYLRTSEQIDSALGCDAALAEALEIGAAGGVLVQAMPGGQAAIVREAQHRLRTGALFAALAGGPVDAEALARAALGDVPFDVLDTRPVGFRCQCSRQRVTDMLRLLGPEDLEALIAEGRAAEITCNFCNERYEVPLEELEAVKKGQAPHGAS